MGSDGTGSGITVLEIWCERAGPVSTNIDRTSNTRELAPRERKACPQQPAKMIMTKRKTLLDSHL